MNFFNLWKRQNFYIGFPVNAGDAISSFGILLRLTKGRYPYVIGKDNIRENGISGLREGSGAEFVFTRLPHEMQENYCFEFKALLDQEELQGLTPKNLVDYGDSDSVACALASAQSMSGEPGEKIVFVSCSFQPAPENHGLCNLLLNRVTEENKDETSQRNSLENKWSVACRENAYALVLYEKDAEILSKAIQKPAISLRQGSFLKKQEKEPHLISCKADQLLLLAKALNINPDLFVYAKGERRVHKILYPFFVVLSLVLTALLIYLKPAPVPDCTIRLSQETYPCVADSFWLGYSFPYAYELTHNKQNLFKNFMGKAGENLGFFVSEKIAENYERIEKKHGTKAEIACRLGYSLGSIGLQPKEKQGTLLAQIKLYASSFLFSETWWHTLEKLTAIEEKKERVNAFLMFCWQTMCLLENRDRAENKTITVDLDMTEEHYALSPLRTIQTQDGKFFYVSGYYGSFYDGNQTNHCLLKFNSQGQKIWQYLTPEKSKCNSSCFLDQEGNIYFVSVDKEDHLRIKKLSSEGKLLWEEILPNTNILRMEIDSFLVDTSNHLWLAASEGTKESPKMVIFHLDSQAKLLDKKMWDKSPCDPTSLISDGKKGFYVAGVSRKEKDISSSVLLHLDETGAVDSDFSRNTQYSIRPNSMLRQDSTLYIAAKQARKDFSVWKYDISRPLKPVLLKEIVPPQDSQTTDSNIEAYFPMVCVESQMIIGYYKLNRFEDKGMAIINEKGQIAWNIIQGWPNYHEAIIGFYISPYSLISVEYNNHAYSDRSVIGLTTWNILSTKKVE